MKTTFVSKENNIAKFTMEFTAEEFEAAVVKAYQASKGQFMIDGFRKGKAPRSIIEKHYGVVDFHTHAESEEKFIKFREELNKEIAKNI